MNVTVAEGLAVTTGMMMDATAAPSGGAMTQAPRPPGRVVLNLTALHPPVASQRVMIARVGPRARTHRGGATGVLGHHARGEGGTARGGVVAARAQAHRGAGVGVGVGAAAVAAVRILTRIQTEACVFFTYKFKILLLDTVRV